MKTSNLKSPARAPSSVNRLAKALAIATLLSAALTLFAADRPVRNEGAIAARKLPRISRLPGGRRLQIAIGLRFRNYPALTNLLDQVYSRTSTNFHRFLTPEQFAERFGPSQSEYDSVMQFATTNGLRVGRTFGNRAHLEVSGTVADLERAFHVTLGTYRHPTEDREFYAPDVEPAVDESLPVIYIQGLDNFFIPKPSSITEYHRRGPQPDTGSGTNGLYLGNDFRHAYAPGVSLNGAGQVVGLVEFDGYTPGDITQYQNLAGVSPNVPVTPYLVDGVSNTAGANNNEVCLDIEIAIAMAPALSHVNVYEGIFNTSVMNEIASPTKGETLPRQVSCSWGIGGDPTITNALLELALQGQSFFYASGDFGSYPTQTGPGNISQIYMTSVGGTILSMNGVGTSYQSEVVWNDGNPTGKDISGGGILINVPIPNYQAPVYMGGNGGSSTWRNVPDVAACAEAIEIVDTLTFTNGNPNIPGQVTGVNGTSAAAPLWAGFTALVNQQNASQGKPTLGFANPAIYEIGLGSLYGPGFHDITVGSNTNSVSPTLYFAQPGYDLCTGWGSPAGQNLINSLTEFSGPVFVDFNYAGSIQNGNYTTPFKTLAAGTNAVANYGTIFIKTAGHSTAPMVIQKPMAITALDGAAVIGN